MLKRIVVTTDGSDRAGRAVAFAGDLAERFGADLTLLHVRVPGGEVPRKQIDKQAAAAKGTLAIVDGDKPDEVICRFAEEADADAIVIGNYGMSADRKQFLMSNVPNRVSHNAPCSVIIVDTRDAKDKKKK